MKAAAKAAAQAAMLAAPESEGAAGSWRGRRVVVSAAAVGHDVVLAGFL